MPYEMQEWRNGDPTTPISAARLLHMEQGIADSVEDTPEGREALAQSNELRTTIAQRGGELFATQQSGLLDGSRFVAIGDSLTEANSDAAAQSWGDSWASIWPLLSFGQARFVYNGGEGGWTSTQLRAEFQQRVLDHNPTLVGIFVGRNDTLDGNNRATVTAENTAWMVDEALAHGAKVFLVNQPPSGSAPISAPTGLAGTVATTGGTLGAATHRYKITSKGLTTDSKETTPSAAVDVVIGSGTTNSIRLDWDHVPGATQYRIYKETTPGSGAYGLVATITPSSGQAIAVKTWTDTGAVTPAAAPPTTNTTGLAYDAVANRKIKTINAWIDWYASRKGVPLVDINTLLTDPQTGMYWTGWTVDGVHPTTTVQAKIAKKVWDTLRSLLKPLSPLIAVDNVDPINLFTDGMLYGGVEGSGATLRPTGWSAPSGGTGGNYTAALAPVAGFRGNAFSVDMLKSDSRFFGQRTVTTGYVAGDRIQVAVHMKTEGAEIGGGQSSWTIRAGGIGVDIMKHQITAYDVEGVMVFEFTVPAGATSLLLRGPYLASGKQKVTVGEIAWRNLTTLGLVA